MIEAAGGKLAIYDAKGARQLSAEAITVANPGIIADRILFMKEGKLVGTVSDNAPLPRD